MMSDQSFTQWLTTSDPLGTVYMMWKVFMWILANGYLLLTA